MQPHEEENTEDMKNKILARIEELKQEMANIREKLKQEPRQRTSSLGQETQASIRTLEDQMAQVAKCGNEEEDTHEDNDVLEFFTFGDESLSNELTNDLHEMLCGDDDMNVDATLCDLNDVEIVNFLDNCFDDAMYIHNLIGKDRSEGVENENVKEEVEDKKKTRNESVREEVEEKVRNDEKEFEGVKSLVDWVWDLYGMGKLLEAADSKLCENFDEQEMERLMVMGLCSEDTNVRIKFDGEAYVSGQGIQVTPNERDHKMDSKAGRATYVQPLHLWDKATRELADFTTHFTFNINSDGGTEFGDGLAFFLANFTANFSEASTAGAGLGLVDARRMTSPEQFVAVVFDTFSNDMNIPMTNVSINVKSMKTSVSSTAWLNNITNGVDNDASITYSASSQILKVVFTGFWDDYKQPGSLSYEVDLRDCLPEFVHIGFSAATGSNFEKHTVTSWQFDSTPLRSDNVSVSQNQGKKHKKGVLMIVGSSIGAVIVLAMCCCCCKKICAGEGNSEIAEENHRAQTNNSPEERKLGEGGFGRTVENGDNKIALCREMGYSDRSIAMDSEFEQAGGPKKFSYIELEIATNNFSEKLGEGGFGGVYKGMLRDKEVAVKRVSSQSHQGVDEYAAEVKIISRLSHRNLVPLRGWCHDKGELLLVYEYMPGGSLDSYLFKGKSHLNWNARYKIAQGLAAALSYLHEEWEKCVLHRDIKSSNVLLDSSLNARLGDFELAWLVDHENAAEKTYLGGTVGYVAPECHFTLKTSKESDVYSFGIVILEIACGRRSIFPNGSEGMKSLVDWVWDLYGMGKLLEAADPKLCENFDEQEMERLIVIGLWCAHPDNNSRPSITQVVHCLKFQFQLPILPPKMPKPVYSTCTSAVSFSAPCSSGTEPFERQEFEYHTNSSRDNTRLTSSSVSGGSSTSASLPQIF
nr:L-type lectin-domain containing receptor kinase IX.1-like [Ipomoea batatas]